MDASLALEDSLSESIMSFSNYRSLEPMRWQCVQETERLTSLGQTAVYCFFLTIPLTSSLEDI